jgi:YVTN family beta-propeller protein
MRRRSLILSSLAVTALPRLARAAGKAACFVVNSLDASVSVIDVARKTVTATIPMLREPHHLVLTPDKKSVIVGDTTANSFFFLDPYTGEVQRRLAASDPYQLLFSPNGTILTTTCLANARVEIFEVGTYALKYRIKAPTLPSHIAYSPDSRRVFVTLQGTDGLMAIDTATGTPLWTVPIGTTPAGVLWHEGKLLVGIMGEAHFAVADPDTGKIIKKIAADEGSHTIFRDHYTGVLYGTNRVAGTLTVIDPHSLNPVQSIRMPGFPDDLEFSPDGKIWAALRHAHAVGVLDPKTGEIERIRVGRGPHGIWLNTHDGLV